MKKKDNKASVAFTLQGAAAVFADMIPGARFNLGRRFRAVAQNNDPDLTGLYVLMALSPR